MRNLLAAILLWACGLPSFAGNRPPKNCRCSSPEKAATTPTVSRRSS